MVVRTGSTMDISAISAKKGGMNEGNVGIMIILTQEYTVCCSPRESFMTMGDVNVGWNCNSTQGYATVLLLKQSRHFLFPFLDLFQPHLVNAFNPFATIPEPREVHPVPNRFYILREEGIELSCARVGPRTVTDPPSIHPSCLAGQTYIHEQHFCA